MSRYWRPVKTQGAITGYSPKATPHKRTAAWTEARALRLLNRKTVKEQPRDKSGFITRKTVENGNVRVRMIDPGTIDRWLWTEAHKKDDDSKGT